LYETTLLSEAEKGVKSLIFRCSSLSVSEREAVRERFIELTLINRKASFETRPDAI